MNVSKTKHEDDLPQAGATEASAQSESQEETAVPSSTEQPVEVTLESVLAERDANYENWLRAQAELENYRKRVQKEAEQNRLYEALPTVRSLLPGLDNLGRAIAAAENSQNVEELIEGVKMVSKQLEAVLAERSVVVIEAIGKPFDPNLHEAVQQLPSEDVPALTILEEVERGYTIHDRVVRPSKVIVSSGPQEQSE